MLMVVVELRTFQKLHMQANFKKIARGLGRVRKSTVRKAGESGSISKLGR